MAKVPLIRGYNEGDLYRVNAVRAYNKTKIRGKVKWVHIDHILIRDIQLVYEAGVGRWNQIDLIKAISTQGYDPKYAILLSDPTKPYLSDFHLNWEYDKDRIPTNKKTGEHGWHLADGHHRLIVVKELGYTEVPAIIENDFS